MPRFRNDNPWESQDYLGARDHLCEHMDPQVMVNIIDCLQVPDKDSILAKEGRYKGNMELLDRLRTYGDRGFRQLLEAFKARRPDLADIIQPEGNGREDSSVPLVPPAATPNSVSRNGPRIPQDDRSRDQPISAAARDFSGPPVPQRITEPANAQPLQMVNGLAAVSQPQPLNFTFNLNQINQADNVQVGDNPTMDVAHTHSASGPDARCDFDVVSEPDSTEPVPDDSDTQTPCSSPQRASQVPQDSHPRFVPSGASLRGAEQEEEEGEEEATQGTENEEPAMHSESTEEHITGGSVVEERANEHDVVNRGEEQDEEETIENEDEGMLNSAARWLPPGSAAPAAPAAQAASPVSEPVRPRSEPLLPRLSVFRQRADEDEESETSGETDLKKLVESDIPSNADIPDVLRTDSDNNLGRSNTHGERSIGRAAGVCNIDISASDNEVDGEEDFIAAAPSRLMPNHLPNGQIHVDGNQIGEMEHIPDDPAPCLKLHLPNGQIHVDGNQIGEMEPIPDDPVVNDRWGHALLNNGTVKLVAAFGVGILVCICVQKLMTKR